MGRVMEREAVKGAYKNPTWARRVNQWSDDQVVAVYLRLKKQKKI